MLDDAPKDILRSVYLDGTVDTKLIQLANEEGRTKSALIAEIVTEGCERAMAGLAAGGERAPDGLGEVGGDGLVMRSVYMPAALDERLKTLAAKLRCPVGGLIRSFVSEGVEARLAA